MTPITETNDQNPTLGDIVYVSTTLLQPCVVESVHIDGTITVRPTGEPFGAYWDESEYAWSTI